MKPKIKVTPEIAECIGLWLAEGDTETKREITFTNNCCSLVELHPAKREKFWRIFNGYKESHYPNHLLENNILKLLNRPYTSLELSKKFKRSQVRIQDILIPPKKEEKLRVFRVKSKSYWIKTDRNKIIISKIKEKYLKSLKRSGKTANELAKESGVCWKAAYGRFTELQKLNLVVRNCKGFWEIESPKEEVVVL